MEDVEKLIEDYRDAVLMADWTATKANQVEPLMHANNRSEEAKAALLAAFTELQRQLSESQAEVERLKHDLGVIYQKRNNVEMERDNLQRELAEAKAAIENLFAHFTPEHLSVVAAEPSVGDMLKAALDGSKG